MIGQRIKSLLRLLTLASLALLIAGCARFYDWRDKEPAPPPPAISYTQTYNHETFTPVPPLGAREIAIPASGFHKVVRGNTVYSVARLYGVPVRAIIKTNKLRPPYLLRVGDKLRLASPRAHMIAKGDTVYSISRRYGVQMNALTRANGIKPPYTISVGRKLTIPAGTARPVKAKPPQVADKIPVAAPKPVASPKPRPKPATPDQVAALPSPPARTGKLFSWPVSGKLLSNFGSQSDGRHNDGLNIKARRGATVVAAESGVVAYAGDELRGFGSLLLIKHAGGFMTAYAHNDALLVKRGEKVRRGQAIARVGSSGSVDSPQLHFEIRKGRKAVDPLRYLPKHRASS